MKRILPGIVATFLGLATANAALVLSNSFEYIDGALVSVSQGSPLGLWITHSGTGSQVDVLSGRVNLTQAESEDVSCALTNDVTPPFSTGVLYASMTVNFSGLPAGAGGYFWHYRDTGTSLFKARLFATTTGAAQDKYRVGIANGGNTPVVIPTDLDLNADYRLVVRYNVETAVATLWINPNSEASMVNRAEGADTTTPVGMYYVCMRQSTSSGNGMGTLTLDDLLIGTEFGDVAQTGGAPTISGISKQAIAANSSTGPLAFSVDDVETPADALTVSAVSDNPALVPNELVNLQLGGAGKDRTLTVTPAAGQEGVAHITVSVTDGDGLSSSTSFELTVGAPAISAIADQVTPVGVATKPIPFTVFDAETPGSLVISKSSSNPGVVSDSAIVVSGTGTDRTVTITPTAGLAGLTKITLTVSDGVQSASTGFNLTVFPALGAQLGDDFEYPDGPLTTSGGGVLWRVHSGTAGDANVVSAQLQLTYTNQDDVSAFFTNSVSFTADSGVILYSKFDVNFSVVPSGSGEYFGHFKDAGTVNYRARVFAMTNGAAPGKFRIGIANGGFTVAAVPRDLDLNATYTVVSRYNVGTASSTVWINPRSEDSPGATAADPTTPIEIWQYAFRQNSGIGKLTVDNFKVGTSFSDVVTELPPPEPIPLNIHIEGNEAVLTWSEPAFFLEEAMAVGGPYTRLQTAQTGHRISIGSAPGGKFYRLVYP